MMNIKYFLLTIFLSLALTSDKNNTDSIENKFGYIETEKKYKQTVNLNSLLSRNLELIKYQVSIGNAIPLKGNLRNNFKSGKSISLCISTPYKTPKLLNKYIFKISSELSFTQMANKPEPFSGSFNSATLHLFLDDTIKKLEISYGFGFAQLFSKDIKLTAPSFKLKINYKLNPLLWYSFLANNYIIKENKKVELFLQKIEAYIGLDPQLTFGFPFIAEYSDRRNEPIIYSNMYFNINLFDL